MAVTLLHSLWIMNLCLLLARLNNGCRDFIVGDMRKDVSFIDLGYLFTKVNERERWGEFRRWDNARRVEGENVIAVQELEIEVRGVFTKHTFFVTSNVSPRTVVLGSQFLMTFNIPLLSHKDALLEQASVPRLRLAVHLNQRGPFYIHQDYSFLHNYIRREFLYSQVPIVDQYLVEERTSDGINVTAKCIISVGYRGRVRSVGFWVASDLPLDFPVVLGKTFNLALPIELLEEVGVRQPQQFINYEDWL